MKRKHEKALQLIFKRPVSGNVQWKDAIALMKELGAEIEEKEGSRTAILLDGEVMYQHRPHPSPTMNKGAIAAMRKFLERKGYKP